MDWLDRFERENDNFRAVLRRAIRRNDAATAVRMGRALSRFWHMGSSHSEGRSWMEQITALPSAGPRERAVAWTIGAIESFFEGNFAPLQNGLDEAAGLAVEPADHRMMAFAVLLRTIASGVGADDEQGQDALADASRRLEAEGEPLAVGLGLVARAYLARVHGHPDEAQRLAQAAYDLSTRSGEWYVRMSASTQLASATLELGDPARAQQHAREALLAAQRLKNVIAGSYTLELWATAELRTGRVEHAGRLFALAERGYQQAGSGPWPTDAALHRQLTATLQAALGHDYERMLAAARDVAYDQAIAELSRPQPEGQ